MDTRRFAHGWPKMALLVPVLVGLVYVFLSASPAHASLLNCATPPPGVICKGGILVSNETWTNANVYVIDSNFLVSGGVTLTISAGTVVKVYLGTYFNVQGTLVLDTSGQPVTFTSIRDDSIGGDTNGDGNGTQPAPGDWQALYVERADPYTPVVTGAAVVHYSNHGLEPYNSSATPMNLTISGWTFEKNNYGILLSPVKGSITATVTSNAFNQNTYGFGTDFGITTTASASLVSNTFTNQTRFPIYLGGTAYPTYSGNTFSGNQYHAIGVHGHFNSSGTWAAVNGGADTGGQTFPYVVYEDVNEDLPADNLDGVQIGDGATVTLPANSVVKFFDLCRLTFGPPAIWHACYLDVVGALNLQSSLGSPIYFTSFKDDAIGGDANGDGATTSPAPGDWDGVYLHNSATNFHDAVVRYSSNGVSVYGYITSDVAPTITQVSFTQNLTRSVALKTFSTGSISSLISNNSISGGIYGIYLETANGPLNPTVTSNTVQGNVYGLYAITHGPGVGGPITSNTFQNNSAAGVFFLGEYGDIDAPLVSNTFKNSLAGVDMYISATATINSPVMSNTFQNNSYGLVTESRVTFDNQGHVNYLASGASRPALTNNTFATHSLFPIALLGSGWPTYSGNSFSNDFYPAIGLGGYHANTGGTWPIVTGDNGQPFPYVVNSDLFLYSSGAVTFSPGAVVKFKPGVTLNAFSVFIFSGTPGNNTVLTSWKDDSVSGDTNHDGNASGPAQDDWRAVFVENDGWPSTGYIDVRYSTFGIVIDGHAANDTNNCPTFSHSSFSHNGHGLYFFVTLPPNFNSCPSVNTSTFTKNFSGVTLETWSDGNLLTVISNSVFLSNTYAVTTLTRDWPLYINSAVQSSQPLTPTKRSVAEGVTAASISPKTNFPDGPDTTTVIPPATGAALPFLVNNTIQGSYFPLFLGGTGFPSYSGNVFLKSVHPGIRVGGVFNNSRLYNSTFTLVQVNGDSNLPMPYVVTQDPTLCDEMGQHCVIKNWKINYDTYKAYGATVSLPPNTVVKLDQGSFIEVPGELDVQGVDNSPVIFTSYRDDSIDGDTNADGHASTPARGDWNGVYLESSGVRFNYQFAHAFFKYGTYALVVYDVNANNIFPVVDHNTFYENATGLLLYTESSGNVIDPRDQQGHWSGPLVHDNLFFNNTTHIFRSQPTSGSGKVDVTVTNNCLQPTTTFGVNEVVASELITATQNWWGSSSGPSNSTNPSGQGVPVSNHVLFNPWLSSIPGFCQNTLYGAQGRVAGLGDSSQTPNPLPGVTVVLNNSVYTTTNQAGNFSISGLAPGQYTVQPFLNGYIFSPTTWLINVPPNALGLAFVGSPVVGQTYTAQGRVLDKQQNPVGNVTILASGGNGASSIAQTAGNGNYTIQNLPVGTYTLTPVLSGYTFSPSSRQVTISSNVTGQDFTRRDFGEVNSSIYLPLVRR